MKPVLLALIVVITSCSLYRDFTTKQFHYSVNNKNYTVPVQVPKGYTREKTIIDSAGNPVQFFYYNDGAFLYTAHVNDSVTYPPIDNSRNVPLPHPLGGLIYKGIKDDGLFWREIRLNNGLIYGYRNVPKDKEIEFDRAVDFSSLKKNAE